MKYVSFSYKFFALLKMSNMKDPITLFVDDNPKEIFSSVYPHPIRYRNKTYPTIRALYKAYKSRSTYQLVKAIDFAYRDRYLTNDKFASQLRWFTKFDTISYDPKLKEIIDAVLNQLREEI